MAVVVKVDNNGIILVRPTIEPKLSELQDINITSIADNQILRYNSATSRWENSSELTTAETNISEILSGDQIVGKAVNDQNGDEIDTTYLKVATASSTYVPLSSKGVANGVAPLGADNKIPSIHLPGGVDDIKEFADLASFPLVGEASIIYVALDTNKIYRWGGSAYVEISSSLALGTTNTTAFPGDRGLAVETLADNIVDGTQTLTDTRVTNSATNVQPLIVNAINGTDVSLQEWQKNGSILARFQDSGVLRLSTVANLSSGNNALIGVATTGTIISRNIADANPSLIVNQANASSTGDILRLQFAGANKLEITKDGFINQNGTRYITNPTTNSTFIGLLSGGNSTTGTENTSVGRASLNNLTSGGQNTALGQSAGRTITTGSQNTFIGDEAGFNASQLATATNSVAIGRQAYTDKSNQMVFGNSSVSEFVFNRNTGALVLMPQSVNIGSTYSVELRSSSNIPRIDFVFNSSYIGQVSSTSTNLVFRNNLQTNGNFSFETRTASEGSATSKVTILNDGKVGIGTSAPSDNLHILAPNGSSSKLRLTQSGIQTYSIGVPATSTSFVLRNETTTTDNLTITTTGLVGINETSPSAQLQVKSGATTRVPLVIDTLASHTEVLQEWRTNTTSRAFMTTNGQLGLNQGIRNFTTGNNAAIDVATTGTLIFRNVADTNPALIVNLANASATGNIQVWQKSGSAKAYITNSGGFETQFNLQVDMENSIASDAIYVYESVSGNDLFYVQASGDTYNANGTYGTISDLRLKENIVQARDYTEDLMKLNVVKYSFKKDHSETPTHLGFIAQEVEEVFPGLVETRKTKELEDMKAIKMSVLIPMLVKTIQEQQKQIDELKAKIG
jgi:hypothetical protein